MASAAPTGSPKICIWCKQDCSNKPRLKDADGNYACKSCVAAREARAPRANSAPAPAELGTPLDDASAADVDLAGLPSDGDPSGGVSPELMCSNCGAYQGTMDQCVSCGYSRSEGKVIKVKKAKPAKSPSDGKGGVLAGALGAAVASNPIVWALGGLLLGSIGSGIWALVSWKTHYEIGWIAWGIGVLAGIGVSLVCGGGRQGMVSGIIACVCAIACIAGGKYAAIAIEGNQVFAKFAANHKFDDHDLQVRLARQVAADWSHQGKPLVWPKDKDKDPDEAEAAADFPPGVWDAAQAKWNQGEKWQADYREKEEAAFQQNLVLAKPKIIAAVWKRSFGFFDILWCLLAIGSAFKIASGGTNND